MYRTDLIGLLTFRERLALRRASHLDDNSYKLNGVATVETAWRAVMQFWKWHVIVVNSFATVARPCFVDCVRCNVIFHAYFFLLFFRSRFSDVLRRTFDTFHSDMAPTQVEKLLCQSAAYYKWAVQKPHFSRPIIFALNLSAFCAVVHVPQRKPIQMQLMMSVTAVKEIRSDSCSTLRPLICISYSS